MVEAGEQIGDALLAAVRGGHGEVVTDLLENGEAIAAKSTVDGRTLLHVAAEEGKPDIVRLLMLRGADKDALDTWGYTPLYIATNRGQVASALALLAGGADFSIRCGESERTVVDVAAEGGHVDILRAAIEHGADEDAADAHQITALHRAAFFDRTEAIDVLVEAGANIEARATDRSTPLHDAAGGLSLEALSALFKHGAYINPKNTNRNTPLHFAALGGGTQGAAEVVDMLLRLGADETIVDDYGKTAADIVGEDVPEENRLAADVECVLKLLANAPANRAWRRRGYLVLCRAHPDRMRQAQESGSAGAGMSRRTRSAAKLRRLASRHHASDTETVDEGLQPEWESVVAVVLKVYEEGIFRTIVGYL